MDDANINQLLACYFPTTVVLVDDNKKFTKHLHAAFDGPLDLVKVYNDPIQALGKLESQSAMPVLSRCVKSVEEAQIDHRSLDIDVPSIHKEVFNTARFSTRSVIVIDYAMPGMDGEEFCEELKDMPALKLMLTGEADEGKAVELFNKGIIDRFIRKDAPDFELKLRQTIEELNQVYFSRISSLITNSIVDNPDYLPSCLRDKNFIALFNDILQANNIVEYYLLDPNGSYLLVDADGKPVWFIVKDEETMEGLYEAAEHASKAIDGSILQKLKDKTCLVHGFTEEQMLSDPDEWGDILFPAEQLKGARTDYYYSIVQKSNNIDFSDIASLNKYRSSLH